MGYADVHGLNNVAGDQINPATEDTLQKRSNAFATLLNAQAIVGQEILMDDILAGDLYIGRNADSASQAAATWEVVRIYRTSAGITTRIRYRSGVVWNNRTAGW